MMNSPPQDGHLNYATMRHIIIMGASSGIGLSVARALLTADVKVGLAARRTEEFKILKEQYPDKVEYESIDVTDRHAPAQLEKLIKKTGGMDLYIHSSGIGSGNPALDSDTELKMVDVNVVGFTRMITAAFRYFRDNHIKGQIAAITSIAGTRGIADMSAYSASKSFDSTYLTALEQLSRRENLGITITDIRPGWTATPLIRPDGHYPMLMTTPYVTARVLRAIALKKHVAVIDWRWNLVVGLWRLLPRAIWTRVPMRVDL